MDTKWFTVSLSAVRIPMGRRDRKTYLGSSRIRDILAECRGGRNCQQYVALQRQKNGRFFPVGVVKSWVLDTTIWLGASAEEVEAEVLEILLEKFKRSEGWRDHTVVAKQIGVGAMDAIAGTHLAPILDEYKGYRREKEVGKEAGA